MPFPLQEGVSKKLDQVRRLLSVCKLSALLFSPDYYVNVKYGAVNGLPKVYAEMILLCQLQVIHSKGVGGSASDRVQNRSCMKLNL